MNLWLLLFRLWLGLQHRYFRCQKNRMDRVVERIAQQRATLRGKIAAGEGSVGVFEGCIVKLDLAEKALRKQLATYAEDLLYFEKYGTLFAPIPKYTRDQLVEAANYMGEQHGVV